LSQPVYGRITNYRSGNSTQYPHECLIQFNHEDLVSRAGELIGQKVVWKSKNNEFIGKISGFHGENDVLKVKFKKGVPGQAMGTLVNLILLFCINLMLFGKLMFLL